MAGGQEMKNLEPQSTEQCQEKCKKKTLLFTEEKLEPENFS